MRSIAFAVTAALALALAACGAGSPPAATVEDLPELVLQPSDVPQLRLAGEGPPRVGGERQTVNARAWQAGYHQRGREIRGVFMIQSRAEVFTDEAAAAEAFRRLVMNVARHDLLTGLPTTGVRVPPITDDVRAWTADFEPMTVASVAWRSGNVVAWIALQGPARDEAVRTAATLAAKQQARIGAAS